MRIGIDARLYGPKHGGIGRYTSELIKNLELIDLANDYFIFLAHDNYNDYQPQNPKFKKVSADFKVYGIFEQLLYPFLLYKYNLNLVHFPHFNVPLLYAKRFVVTIHDLIISHYPSTRATTLSPLLYQSKLFMYNWIVKSAARRAKKIIAVSEFTKQDIVKHLGVKSDKIQVAYEGVDLPAAGNDCGKVLGDLGISAGDFILYVGSAYPHKNLEKLIEAHKIIQHDRPLAQLVLAGKKNFFYERLQEWYKNGLEELPGISEAESRPDAQQNIIFTDYLSDQDLACLYQGAAVYAFPSLIEGFGLPPLEAQTYGLAVVSSDRTCLPEILGDSAIYFDPEQTSDIAEKIMSLLDNKEKRAELTKRGLENVKKYSWAKMAKEIQSIYLN